MNNAQLLLMQHYQNNLPLPKENNLNSDNNYDNDDDDDEEEELNKQFDFLPNKQHFSEKRYLL